MFENVLFILILLPILSILFGIWYSCHQEIVQKIFILKKDIFVQIAKYALINVAALFILIAIFCTSYVIFALGALAGSTEPDGRGYVVYIIFTIFALLLFFINYIFFILFCFSYGDKKKKYFKYFLIEIICILLITALIFLANGWYD